MAHNKKTDVVVVQFPAHCHALDIKQAFSEDGMSVPTHRYTPSFTLCLSLSLFISLYLSLSLFLFSFLSFWFGWLVGLYCPSVWMRLGSDELVPWSRCPAGGDSGCGRRRLCGGADGRCGLGTLHLGRGAQDPGSLGTLTMLLLLLAT